VAASADARVKGFADACRKNKEDVAEGVVLEGIVLKGIVCCEDGEGERRREEVVASPVKVELRRLWRNTVIISLSLISVFASLSFV
jgi:hypothetical protein